MSWIAYALTESPAGDFGWMPLYSTLRARMVEEIDEGEAEMLDSDIEQARELAIKAGWTGELGEPYVFTLPHPDTLQFGLMWKNKHCSDDGEITAIVISPQALPWMGEPSAVLDD